MRELAALILITKNLNYGGRRSRYKGRGGGEREVANKINHANRKLRGINKVNRAKYLKR